MHRFMLQVILKHSLENFWQWSWIKNFHLESSFRDYFCLFFLFLGEVLRRKKGHCGYFRRKTVSGSRKNRKKWPVCTPLNERVPPTSCSLIAHQLIAVLDARNEGRVASEVEQIM